MIHAMKSKIKPRNPFAALAMFRNAGSPECTPAMAPEDQACIAHALLSPPSPAPALVNAFARHRKLFCQT
jgi:hypothetical protein